METTGELIERFNDGTLTAAERETLYAAFLNRADVREAWPDAARVIVPLALAAASRDGKQQLTAALHPVRRIAFRRWSLAASITLLIAVGSSALLYAANSRHEQTYCSNSGLTDNEIDQWFNNTLATTL